MRVDLFKRTFAKNQAKLIAAMGGLKSDFHVSQVVAEPDYEGTLSDFYTYLAKNLSR